jgi:4a-hydroxytetrahydrobiopterin dehydratase
MKKLDIEQAEPIRKKFASDWEIRRGKYLYKKVAFDDYNQAVRFFMAIEKPQIKLDHFADIGFFYNEVILMVYTHDVGGLTQLDFELTLYIDKILKQMGAKEIG